MYINIYIYVYIIHIEVCIISHHIPLCPATAFGRSTPISSDSRGKPRLHGPCDLLSASCFLQSSGMALQRRCSGARMRGSIPIGPSD